MIHVIIININEDCVMALGIHLNIDIIMTIKLTKICVIIATHKPVLIVERDIFE